MNEALERSSASGCVGWHPRVAVLLLTFSFSLASVLCYHLPTMSCVYMKIKTVYQTQLLDAAMMCPLKELLPCLLDGDEG
jgi:hypothetical protein